MIHVSDGLVERVSKAFAKSEGFGVPGALPTRCHNPGDLTDDGDVGFGTARSVGYGAADITIYACDEDGWNAMRKKVRRALEGNSKVYRSGFTIEEVGMIWARDPNWAINAARELGVSPSTTLEELVAADAKSPEIGSADA
jgi:hypothetical protein